jgi:arsenical pump membrane protein
MHGVLHMRPHAARAHWDGVLCAVGLLGLALALVLDPHAAISAAGQTWTPFVLVTGLLLVGLTAEGDGLFRFAGSQMAARASSDLAFGLGAALLIVVVTATLNLDTSVVFVTPVLIAAASQRGSHQAPLLYGSLLLANAGSLFLPGSNLTNLIVLGQGATSATRFFGQLWPAALAASVVTALIVGLWGRRQPEQGRPTDPDHPSVRASWSAPAIGATLVVVLVAPDPALLVLAIGLAISAAHVHQGRLTPERARAVVAPCVLVGLFGVATAMGTVGRAWSGPASALAHLGSVGTAVGAALSAVVLNNLPAAALLAARHPAHAPALLVGLNLGPNLFVTGSLAWFLWLRIARSAGAAPSIWQASRLGLVVVPLSMTAALLALWAC